MTDAGDPDESVRRGRNAMDRLRFARRLTRGIEAAQVRWLGASALSLLFRTRVLVLTTTGRRSGRSRETTLAYLELGDGDLLVVGGAGGQSRTPDWVANLRADPAVQVTVGRTRRPMTACELHGDARAAAWNLAVDEWPRIVVYESRAGRAVPVVRLTSRFTPRADREGERRVRRRRAGRGPSTAVDRCARIAPHTQRSAGRRPRPRPVRAP